MNAQGRTQGWVGGAGVGAQAQMYILGQFWGVRAGLLLKAAHALTRSLVLPCYSCAVPALQTSLVFISQRIMRGLRFKTTEDGAKRTAMWWRTVNKYRQHWQARGCRTGRAMGPVGRGCAWHVRL